MIGLARWLVLAGLLLTPWPYASVPRWVQPSYTAWLLAATACWIAGLAAARRRPILPRGLLCCLALLLVQGWLLIANAQYSFRWSSFDFVPAHPFWPGGWAPGALDTVEAGPNMLRLTSLLGAFCILIEMATLERWRARLLRTLLAGGMLIVTYGLAQTIFNAPLGLWDRFDFDRHVFASFYYHGNAGAFVNLLLPGMVIGALRAASRRRRLLFSVGLMLALSASVAIASKAAMLLSAALVLAAFLLGRGGAPARLPWRKLAAPALALAAAAAWLGSRHAWERWRQLPQLLQWHNPRLLAWRACLRMLPDAGPWGIGPGNFKFAFPHYTYGLHGDVAGFWEYAHQDYLQTAIEWGWCGFVLWAYLIGRPLWRRPPASPALLGCWLACLGLLIHAALDYPLQIPALQLYAAGYLAILWAESWRVESSDMGAGLRGLLDYWRRAGGLGALPGTRRARALLVAPRLTNPPIHYSINPAASGWNR